MRGGGTECNPPELHRFGVRVLLGGRPLGAGRKAACSGPSENSQEARGIRQGKLRDLPSTVLRADCWAVSSCGPWSHSPAWFPVDGRVASVSSGWTGLEELGEREDRAGRLEPWARVMGGGGGSAARRRHWSLFQVARGEKALPLLCLDWASEEFRRQGSLRRQVWSQLGEGRAGQMSPGWGWAEVPRPHPWLPSCRCWCGKILPLQPTQQGLRRWAASLPIPGPCGLLAPPHLRGSPPRPRGRACQPSLLQGFLGAAPPCSRVSDPQGEGLPPGPPWDPSLPAASPSQGAGVGTDLGGEDRHVESGDEGVALLPLYTPQPSWRWAGLPCPSSAPASGGRGRSRDGAEVEGRAGQGRAGQGRAGQGPLLHLSSTGLSLQWWTLCSCRLAGRRSLRGPAKDSDERDVPQGVRGSWKPGEPELTGVLA